MAISNKPQQVGLSDPHLIRQTESKLAQDALIAKGKPAVIGDTVVLPSTTVQATPTSVTTTTSANNQVADTTTVYQTNGTVYVSSIDQTVQNVVNKNIVNQIGVTNIVAGTNISITSTDGNGAGTVTINTTTPTLGNISVINLDGNASNVLHGNGYWSPDLTTYSNSNVVSLMAAFGSNTIVTTGNANVGNLSTAQVLATANITAPQIIANIATGTAPFVVTSTTQVANLSVATAGSATTAGTVTTNAQPNITSVGTLASLTVTGNITGGNLTGPLANGNSNVNIATANGNVTLTAVGNTTMTITGTGANITGTANITGNITTTGNIGVGTSTPDAELNILATPQTVSYPVTGNSTTSGTDLHISGADGSNTRITQDAFGTGSYVAFTGRAARGTAASPTQTQSGDTLTQFTARGFSNGTLQFGNSSTGRVDLVAAENFTDTSRATNVVVYTTATGSITPAIVATFTGTGANITGTANISGNANVGNLGTATAIITTGNITTINSGLLQNGTSNVTITSGANVSVFTAGNATAQFVVTSSGANIPGTANVTGNANVGNIGANNGVFTGNISGNTNGFTIGYLNIPQVAASNTTIALTDAGKHYYSTSTGNFTLTVPNNTTTSFATGTAISIVVQSTGNVLVNAATGVTLYMAGNSTAANRVVSNYGMATIMKVATDTWMINGTGVA